MYVACFITNGHIICFNRHSVVGSFLATGQVWPKMLKIYIFYKYNCEIFEFRFLTKKLFSQSNIEGVCHIYLMKLVSHYFRTGKYVISSIS